ncbi:MAG: hypothetical protein KA053_05460 [Lentimicrobiaceae bacterium]|nr:hypothetical protein [Lentimicrobiaceae bacterium]
MRTGCSIILASMLGLMVHSCNDEAVDPIVNTTDKIRIISLSLSNRTIRAYDTTAVTVVAEGDDLVYNWEADHGYIIGNGNAVHYTAGECCVGINTIKCLVSNVHGQVSDTIKVRVKSYFDP